MVAVDDGEKQCGRNMCSPSKQSQEEVIGRHDVAKKIITIDWGKVDQPPLWYGASLGGPKTHKSSILRVFQCLIL